MRLIRSIAQRITDWRRERRITLLFRAARMHMQIGQWDLAREAWDAYMDACRQRSDAQLTRLAIAELRRHPYLARAQIEQAKRESGQA